MTVAACAGGPLALAVLCPRSKKRDVALYAMQMWAFIMVHEIPFDDPERLRARLRSRYPIVADRALGGGQLPNTRLQRRLARLPRVGLVNRVLTWTHWLWFFEPYVALALVLIRNNSASRALPARWPLSSTSAAPSTSPCRRRRRGGPRSRA